MRRVSGPAPCNVNPGAVRLWSTRMLGTDAQYRRRSNLPADWRASVLEGPSSSLLRAGNNVTTKQVRLAAVSTSSRSGQSDPTRLRRRQPQRRRFLAARAGGRHLPGQFQLHRQHGDQLECAKRPRRHLLRCHRHHVCDQRWWSSYSRGCLAVDSAGLLRTRAHPNQRRRLEGRIRQ